MWITRLKVPDNNLKLDGEPSWASWNQTYQQVQHSSSIFFVSDSEKSSIKQLKLDLRQISKLKESRIEIDHLRPSIKSQEIASEFILV